MNRWAAEVVPKIADPGYVVSGMREFTSRHKGQAVKRKLYIAEGADRTYGYKSRSPQGP